MFYTFSLLVLCYDTQGVSSNEKLRKFKKPLYLIYLWWRLLAKSVTRVEKWIFANMDTVFGTQISKHAK